MKRLRVLHIDAGATWRGGQRQVFLLALGLRERGHEPLLMGSPDSPLVVRARAAGLAVATVRMRGDWDVAAARRIRSRMRAWNADVVHAHDARAHALALMALFGSRDKPLVVTRRVPFAPKSVRMKYGERVSCFIAISRAVRDAMVGSGIAAGRVEVVHSGVELPRGHTEPHDWRRELGWRGDTVVCGVVGAMTEEKGVDGLASIARLFSPELASRTRVVLAGGSAFGPMMIGPVAAYSAGFVTEILPAIAGFDVLWHPSRVEGLGTSVIDAMAVGVPAVAFAVGGLPEVIENDVSGLLVPGGDIGSFASAAGRLISDARLRARLGEGARARARAFGAAAMTERTETVYYRVLAGSHYLP